MTKKSNYSHYESLPRKELEQYFFVIQQRFDEQDKKSQVHPRYC